MPRVRRTDIGEYVYHIINRANARVQIFDSDKDYQLFEIILEEAVEKFDMRLLSYCIMPNHWHLVLYPKNDGELARFMGWLTNTHTRRWHTEKGTIGQGHLYQGRYKSFLCQDSNHFLTLARYVERNARRANLVKKAENWKWSSVWRRENGAIKQNKLLSTWPVSAPKDYLNWLNQAQTEGDEEAIKKSITKGSPYGDDNWVKSVIKRFSLEQTLRKVGRPKANNSG
ncbi:MAG: transposase [Candidatus Omnitrophota bacterium]|nr:transposase [Candidatus Omnitrophota bacterium]